MSAYSWWNLLPGGCFFFTFVTQLEYRAYHSLDPTLVCSQKKTFFTVQNSDQSPDLRFGKLTKLGKITVFHGKIHVISMAMFNGYVSHYRRLPEGHRCSPSASNPSAAHGVTVASYFASHLAALSRARWFKTSFN